MLAVALMVASTFTPAPIVDLSVIEFKYDGSRQCPGRREDIGNASGLMAAPAKPVAMDARSYVVVLEPEPAGGYSAHIPAFRGAHTQGDTIEETLSNARDVITGYVEILAERREPIPPSDLLARNDKLRHLRDAVDAGIADVEAGRTKPLTDELLRAIAQRGRRVSKVRRSGST